METLDRVKIVSQPLQGAEGRVFENSFSLFEILALIGVQNRAGKLLLALEEIIEGPFGDSGRLQNGVQADAIESLKNQGLEAFSNKPVTSWTIFSRHI